ncbi:hypothetical protein CPB83DRAFT_840836 [Crepidotus variabilis]|uniref:Uncharacterized protein n=1 Tax=Crepidotus variabilis TaxID=179855 RepID=A0A9P6E3Q2_9AGAR|nr:hypothetical protein CPB83DRAFT_840836 [Crepidotus variabilis]
MADDPTAASGGPKGASSVTPIGEMDTEPDGNRTTQPLQTPLPSSTAPPLLPSFPSHGQPVASTSANQAWSFNIDPASALYTGPSNPKRPLDKDSRHDKRQRVGSILQPSVWLGERYEELVATNRLQKTMLERQTAAINSAQQAMDDMQAEQLQMLEQQRKLQQRLALMEDKRRKLTETTKAEVEGLRAQHETEVATAIQQSRRNASRAQSVPLSPGSNFLGQRHAATSNDNDQDMDDADESTRTHKDSMHSKVSGPNWQNLRRKEQNQRAARRPKPDEGPAPTVNRDTQPSTVQPPPVPQTPSTSRSQDLPRHRRLASVEHSDSDEDVVMPPSAAIERMADGGICLTQATLMEMMTTAAQTALRFSPHRPRKVQRGRLEEHHRKSKLDDEKEAIPKENKNIFNGFVRDTFKNLFDLELDEDFTSHEPPTKQQVTNFNSGRGEGPKKDDLRIDMRGKIRSAWNMEVTNIIFDEFIKLKTTPGWDGLGNPSDAYFLDMIESKMTRVRSHWKAAQPRLKESGDVETNGDVEERMVETKSSRERVVRVRARRITKFNTRLWTVEKMIEIKDAERARNPEEASDLPSWKWLLKLLQTLGEDGTSSDESDINEQTCSPVCRVKQMDWRQNVDYELRLIDKQRWVDRDVGSGRGAKPMTRIREDRNGSSSCEAPKGLLRAVYDKDWVEALNSYEIRKLCISEEEFSWIRIRCQT